MTEEQALLQAAIERLAVQQTRIYQMERKMAELEQDIKALRST